MMCAQKSPTVKVRVPPGLTDEDMPDFVSSTVDSYYDALDLSDQSAGNAASGVKSEDVRIASVAVSDDSVAVNYLVPSPQDELGEQRVVMAERRGSYLVFPRLFGQGKPSTH